MRTLVTGASRGLGLALCTVLAEQSHGVLAVCRKPTAELEALGVRVLDGVDLATEESKERLAPSVGKEPIDLVVCNAGVNVTYAQDLAELDTAQVSYEFEVNAIGPLRTVQAVLPLLREGSKVAFISTYRPGVGAAKRNYGYQASKVALNQLGFVLADELAERGVVTAILSPGPMATDLMHEVLGTGLLTVEPGLLQDPLDVARELLDRIAALTPADSGAWLFRTGEPLTAPTRVFGH
jgi:NAD(P)-dependent dehydrogenase (short-subunit alcohol dehydrogenase family)